MSATIQTDKNVRLVSPESVEGYLLIAFNLHALCRVYSAEQGEFLVQQGYGELYTEDKTACGFDFLVVGTVEQLKLFDNHQYCSSSSNYNSEEVSLETFQTLVEGHEDFKSSLFSNLFA